MINLQRAFPDIDVVTSVEGLAQPTSGAAQLAEDTLRAILRVFVDADMEYEVFPSEGAAVTIAAYRSDKKYSLYFDCYEDSVHFFDSSRDWDSGIDFENSESIESHLIELKYSDAEIIERSVVCSPQLEERKGSTEAYIKAIFGRMCNLEGRRDTVPIWTPAALAPSLSIDTTTSEGNVLPNWMTKSERVRFSVGI